MLIAITGGIGSGKSVVSQLLRIMGYTVYDCDSRAKWVMTHDPILRQQLIELFGPETYLLADSSQLPLGSSQLPINSSQLNKPYLSSRIFHDSTALAEMNACVHPAVWRDLQSHYSHAASQSSPLAPNCLFFFESAILFESGFDRLSHPDQVWTVSAPLELRITRAMLRDGASRQQILSRIQSQMAQEEKEKRSDIVLLNDAEHSIIAQINQALIIHY